MNGCEWLQNIITFLNNNEGSLMVIITFVYVVATCFICVANIRSAKATKEQVAEAKRQYDEENRAFVTVTFDVIRGGLAALCIDNNVEINISSEFVDNMDDNRSRTLVNKLCSSSFTLGIGRRWYLCLGSHIELKTLGKVPLSVEISYSDSRSQYHETTTIELDQYFWSLIYDSAAEDAREELKNMTKSIESIDKSMKKIQQTIPISKQCEGKTSE